MLPWWFCLDFIFWNNSTFNHSAPHNFLKDFIPFNRLYLSKYLWYWIWNTAVLSFCCLKPLISLDKPYLKNNCFFMSSTHFQSFSSFNKTQWIFPNQLLFSLQEFLREIFLHPNPLSLFTVWFWLMPGNSLALL